MYVTYVKKNPQGEVSAAAILLPDNTVELYGEYAEFRSAADKVAQRRWLFSPSIMLRPFEGEQVDVKEPATIEDVKKVREMTFTPALKKTLNGTGKEREAFASMRPDNEEAPATLFRLNADSVEIVGSKDVVRDWASYFRNPRSGWHKHLEEPNPFESLFGRSSYVDFTILNEEEYEQARAETLKGDVVAKIARWSHRGVSL